MLDQRVLLGTMVFVKFSMPVGVILLIFTTVLSHSPAQVALLEKMCVF